MLTSSERHRRDAMFLSHPVNKAADHKDGFFTCPVPHPLPRHHQLPPAPSPQPTHPCRVRLGLQTQNFT